MQALLLMVALCASGDLQSDYQELVQVADAAREASQSMRGTEVSDADREKYMALRKDLSEKSDAFVEAHLLGDLSPEAAKVLVESSSHAMLRGLMYSWMRTSLEKGEPKAFLGNVDKLEKAGLDEAQMASLDQPRAVAMVAAGDMAGAKELATKKAEELGAGGLGMLDVLAAIHVCEGKLEDARQLFVKYQEKYGEENARSAYAFETKAKMIGQPAEEITVATWIGPKGAESEGWSGLAELRGNVVVMDFWQTWCGPCRVVMPGLSHLQEKMEGKPFEILGLCYKDGRPGYDWAEQKSVPVAQIEGESYVPHVRKFSKDMGLAYTIGVAEDRTNSTAYGIRGIPTLVMVDPQGRVAWITIGAAPGVDLLIEIMAEKMIAGAKVGSGG
ncbi:MAG: TlpA disulfide reductase family protein [Planctomycetota bacterium]